MIATLAIISVNYLSLIATVGIAGGLYLFLRGFRVLARKRLLIDTPSSKIRSAAMGLVEVSGTAIGPYTLPAPISGKACFLYRTTAWKQKEERKNQEWEKVAEETLYVPFFLEDETGRLLIDPNDAELDLHCDLQQKYDQSWLAPLPSAAAHFLERHGIAVSNDHYRIEERTIQPGNPLFAVGTLTDNPARLRPSHPTGDGPGNGPERVPAVPQIIRLSENVPLPQLGQMTQQQKIAAALTKAGIHRPEAWAVAGVDLQSSATRSGAQLSSVVVNTNDWGRVQGTDFDLTPPTILKKGENNPSFLLSWRSQHEVVRSLAWKSAAMIWGGAGLSLLALYVLLAQ